MAWLPPREFRCNWAEQEAVYLKDITVVYARMRDLQRVRAGAIGNIKIPGMPVHLQLT